MPSHPGKEFEIKKRLDRLRGTSNFGNNNNNNNNGGGNNNNLGGNNNLFGPGGEPPSLPLIEDFLDGGPRPPPPPPPAPSISGNLFNNTDTGILPTTKDFNVQTNRANPFVLPTIWSNKGIGNNLFGSQAAMADPREEEKKTKTQQDVDDFLYELPERTMPDLELGDGRLNSLGTNAQNLFDVNAPPSKKEEEEEILKDIMDEYEIEKIRDTMDESAEVPESIYFFYGGDSEQFVNALEFLGLSPINKEFGAFLLSDLGRQTMTQNKLSIRVELGEIFYDNHTLEKTFTISCSLNKMTKQHTHQKIFHIGTVLRRTLALFYKVFLSMIKKSLTFSLSKIQNIFFIVLTILLKRTQIQDTSCFPPKKC